MDFSDRIVGHYRVLNRLGEGAMGVVYRAVDTRLGREVAIKFLAHHLWADGAARNRMMAEARAASSLDHPNIASIYDIGETPETGLYLVMAFYAGELLSHRVRRGALPASEAVKIAGQIASGLSAAHSRGIIHRDIKPDNIMLVAGGLVKVLDFGLAKSRSVHLTAQGAILGTPSFMSPEQLQGDSADHRSDLWALGVVLYNMLTGRLPFSGKSIQLLAVQILKEAPEPPDTSPELQAILAKALEKTPAQRFQTAQAFLQALETGVLPVSTAMMETVVLPSPAAAAEPVATTGGNQTFSASNLGIANSGEIRQVSLLSCDLLDPALLESAAGLEAFSELQARYIEVCASAAARFGGEVADHADIEVRIQFGFPQAHEDDAVRAVKAAFEIVEGAAALGDAIRGRFPGLAADALQVRAGIHTGLAITSNEASRRRNLFGAVGRIAARVRESAAPGAVCVTGETRLLLRTAFEIAPAGEIPAPGAPKPLSVFVVSERNTANDAAGGAARTALVSRERELGALLDCWRDASDGHGQAILISGDAGIGKSRLLGAMVERLAPDRPQLLEARSSPYHSNTPLHPIAAMLARVLRIEKADPPEARLLKLRSFLSKHRFSIADGLAVLAPLLSLPLPDTISIPKLLPQQQREKTQSTLLKLIETVAAKNPALWVVEDLHWADPTTIELLGMAAGRCESSRLLIVMTARTEYTPPWANRSSIKPIALGRMSRRESEQMIHTLARGKRVPREILTRLVENADGVPLFLEELTRNVLTSGDLRETEDSFELTRPVALLAVPSTLKDALMARLDRLGEAKEVAQVASVLGRTFSQEWIEAICPVDAAVISSCLSRLVESDVLFRNGSGAEAEYTFKHALIKDAAYESMLTRTRQQYHERFALTLESQFPDVAELHPELVAHHFTGAGLKPEAIAYWHRAGREARRRSANLEAAAHYSKGLELTASLPDGPDRIQTELELWTALAGAQLATAGYAAPAVGNSYRRAGELGQRAGLSRPLFDALQGLWAFHIVRADVETALQTARRLEEIAVGLKDPALRLEAVLRRGITLSAAGELIDARKCLEEVAAESEAVDHRDSALHFGQDRLVSCLCLLSLVVCLQGELHSAAHIAGRAVMLARELAHPFSLSWAYFYAGLVHGLRNDPGRSREFSDSLKLLCEEHGFSYRMSQAQVLAGWATVAEFEDDSGLDELREGIAGALKTGARVFTPHYQALYADACMRLGRADQAVEAIERDRQERPDTGERIFESEILRVRADVAAIRFGESSVVVRELLTDAVETARRQGARLPELSALVRLAHTEPDNGAVREQVAALLSAMEPDPEAPLLASARALAGTPSRANASTVPHGMAEVSLTSQSSPPGGNASKLS